MAGAVGLFGGGWYVGNGMAEKKHTEARVVELAEHNAELNAARAKEQALQAGADQIKRKSDAKITTLNRRVNSLLGELRNRPERPASGVPENPGSELAGCTGAQLYRPDSEFLVRLAQDADTTREALNQCREAYEALK